MILRRKFVNAKAWKNCPLQSKYNLWHPLAFLNNRNISRTGWNKVICGMEWKLEEALLCIGVSVPQIFLLSSVILFTVCHTTLIMLAQTIWYWINLYIPKGHFFILITCLLDIVLTL